MHYKDEGRDGDDAAKIKEQPKTARKPPKARREKEPTLLTPWSQTTRPKNYEFKRTYSIVNASKTKKVLSLLTINDINGSLKPKDQSFSLFHENISQQISCLSNSVCGTSLRQL